MVVLYCNVGILRYGTALADFRVCSASARLGILQSTTTGTASQNYCGYGCGCG